ncbi:phosphotransferase enzyme family protein [Bordetella bronchialis]|uniref:phosphotransferase enzyme family protein n=1 Tax=Bordetella bronchialis TaxID=463025 RepID=UPI003D080B29
MTRPIAHRDAIMAIPAVLPAVEVVESTIASPSIASIVGREFELPAPQQCSFLAGGFNDNYDLRLPDGRRFIARLSKFRPRGGPNIPFEAALLEHLAREGIAVAAANRTRQGNWSVPVPTPEGIRDLVLFHHLQGRPPGNDLDAIHATGRGLARIHASACHYAGPASTYRLDLDHLLWKPLSRIASLGHIDTDLKTRFQCIGTSVAERLAGLSLTQVICHGDCHGGNNFVGADADGTLVARFFDFDDSGPGYQAYDLAVFLWGQLFRGSHTSLTVDIERAWQAFIDGYRSIGEIRATDLGAVSDFVAARMLWYVGEYAGNIHKLGTRHIGPAWFQRIADLLEQWRELDIAG